VFTYSSSQGINKISLNFGGCTGICTPHPIFWGDKIEKNGMGGVLTRMGKWRGVRRVLEGKPEAK